jgi:hypothetical protein
MHLSLNANNVHVNVASRGRRPTDDASEAKAPLLSVDKWEELALAIDNEKKVWAISPPPENAGVFRKRDAVVVPIRKGDGFLLLTLLAESPNGRSVDIYAVAAKLGLLPRNSPLPQDGHSLKVLRSLSRQDQSGRYVHRSAEELAGELGGTATSGTVTAAVQTIRRNVAGRLQRHLGLTCRPDDVIRND